VTAKMTPCESISTARSTGYALCILPGFCLPGAHGASILIGASPRIGGGATANTIGGNLISGNRGPGLELSDNTTSGNVVLGNFIGTDRRLGSCRPPADVL